MDSVLAPFTLKTIISKMFSLKNCWMVQNILIRKLALNHTSLAIVASAHMWNYYFMHNDMGPENM